MNPSTLFGNTGLTNEEIEHWLYELQLEQEAEDIHFEAVSNYYDMVAI